MSADKEWPDRGAREAWEITEFMRVYPRLEHGEGLSIVTKSERPDYIVETASGVRLGIELTSAYLDDRSVPDRHMKEVTYPAPIDHDRSKINEYENRLVETVRRKVAKAKSGYDTSCPLVLAVYVNEYESIFLSREDWKRLVSENEPVFDALAPFSEVVFYSLANDDVLSVRPE